MIVVTRILNLKEPTNCGYDACDLLVTIAADSRQGFDRSVSGEDSVVVFVWMSEDECRVFFFRYRHVEARIGRPHDVTGAGVQEDRGTRDVTSNSH